MKGRMWGRGGWEGRVGTPKEESCLYNDDQEAQQERNLREIKLQHIRTLYFSGSVYTAYIGNRLRILILSSQSHW